jgi:hypothetical protein
MRLVRPLSVFLAAGFCLGVLQPALGGRARVTPVPRRVAEIRPAAAGDCLWIDGRRAWPPPGKQGRARIVSPVVWSGSGDAVAFTTRDREGRGHLIVLLVTVQGVTAAAPEVLAWRLPAIADAARAVTWLGPTRVGAGPTALDPKVAVSWVAAAKSH